MDTTVSELVLTHEPDAVPRARRFVVDALAEHADLHDDAELIVAELVTNAVLHGAPPDEARRLAALAGGRPGWAVEALARPELVAERAANVDRAVALSEGKLSERLALAGEVCKGESFLESRAACLRTLDDMLVWWRDLLLVATDAAVAPVHAERRDELVRQAERRGRDRIVRGLREIETTAGAVERNVTPRLALEALLLRLV